MANMTKNFRLNALRRGCVVAETSSTPAPPAVARMALVEMAQLGYVLTLEELQKVSVSGLETMLADARTLVGADRDMTPIYPGFPQQVKDLDTLTLIVEQIMHYWSFGLLRPDYPNVVREGLALEDMVRRAVAVGVLPAGSAAQRLTEELTLEPVALSEDDRNLLEGCVELVPPTLDHIASLVTAAKQGENLQSLVKAVDSLGIYTSSELLTTALPGCKTTDQALRVVLTLFTEPSNAVYANNYLLAVTNLADRHARSVRLQRMSKADRRLIIKHLGKISASFYADSLIARQDLWRRVLRAVHPYDFSLEVDSRRAADIIHSNIDYRTLNSLVEEAMEDGNVATVVKLLSENQPGNLLRRVVAILRLTNNRREAYTLSKAISKVGSKSSLTTLISAYNGVISANDEHQRVTRVAGLTNTMVDRKKVVKVNETYLKMVADSIKEAMSTVLKSRTAPTGAVGVLSDVSVPLVRRDLASSDRVLDRGQELTVAGSGDILRIFGHWVNNQSAPGYMDIGVVILDENFGHLAVSTWDTWNIEREWSTYSGDCLVDPGNDAAEFIDIMLDKLKNRYPMAKYAAMTVQSWSGFPMNSVDFIAGAMLRSNGQKGQVFDARSVATAFKPTTPSTQSVPLAVELSTGRMVWIDSSNGSTQSTMSSSSDTTIGSLVYDEIARPRLTMGELASLYADAHGVAKVDEAVDRDLILSLLG
jgi:hypothetical protein